MATTSGLSWLSGRDIRLIALNIGDKEISDPSIGVSLALLAEFCPKASVALLSNRDDEVTISAAMQRGVRGFFPKSIPVEVAIAGLRLVLAGGAYRPLPIIGQNGASSLISEHLDVPKLSEIHQGNGRHQTHAGESDGRPYATRTPCTRGAAARPSQQVDCRQAQPFGKHRKNAYSAYHAKMFRAQPHRGGASLEPANKWLCAALTSAVILRAGFAVLVRF